MVFHFICQLFIFQIVLSQRRGTYYYRKYMASVQRRKGRSIERKNQPRKKGTKSLALMQNHGLVHYFTLDFIPCVLSWTMDSGPLLYTSFFFSTLKNLMQNHGPTRTKKSCPIEQDIVLTGSMIVHEISMQQCTSEESWTHK